MPYDVFVSHASDDKLTADAACAVLESKGLRCWIAPRDILPGKDYAEAIIDAIVEVKVFLLVFSSHANASNQVKREVERAVHRGIPIIPLRIEDVAPTRALEYFISSPHWLDAFSPPLQHHLDHLADVIQALMQGGAAPLEPASARTARRASAFDVRLGAAAAALGALVAVGVVAWLVARQPGASPRVMAATPPAEPASGPGGAAAVSDPCPASPGGAADVVILQAPASERRPGAQGEIDGCVSGLASPQDYKAVIYAYADTWYVQPLSGAPLTEIDQSGYWSNWTHLGRRYAVLIIKAGFEPPEQAQALPPVGGAVAARAEVALSR